MLSVLENKLILLNEIYNFIKNIYINLSSDIKITRYLNIDKRKYFSIYLLFYKFKYAILFTKISLITYIFMILKFFLRIKLDNLNYHNLIKKRS